ncbi:MAG: gliding motility-associated C-terminal domain-containing protein [Flavobacteriales bacterium]
MATILLMKRWYPVRLSLFTFTLLAALRSQAVILDPPVLHCASVNLVGDVTLTWTPPADPGGDFQEYQLFQGPNGGPYSLLTVIPVYGTTTYYHAGAGADSGPNCYFLTTVSTSLPPNTSVPSDTLCTIFLTVGQSAPLGSAVLDWTPQHVPAIGSASANYSIWMEYPQGIWSQVASVPNTALHYEHVIDICDDSLTFRIGLIDALGCVSFSNLAGDVFADATPPSVPVVQTVSVDSLTCLTTVTWDPSPEPDTDGYILVLVTSGGSIVIDTVWGGTSSTFVWAFSGPCNGPETWTVAAFDTCYSGNPASPNTSATGLAHTTVFAFNDYDACDAEITVGWTQYEGWDVAGYELYAQVNGGPWFLLSIHGPGDFSSAHTGVDPFKTYCYVVKAIESGGTRTALSNKTCVVTSYPGLPAFNYVSNVTVVAPNEVLISDEVDLAAEVKRYHLQRSRNGLPFEEVQNIPGGGGPTITFTDTDVQTGERSYRYRVLVEDSCGTVTLTSNEGNTIHLTAEAALDGINRLRWNGYVGWAGVPSGFNIYRSIGDGPFTFLATNPAAQADFLDDVADFSATNGRFCYYVESLEAGNPSGANAVSVSNIACAVQEEQFWVPNAFIAGGANELFIPVTAYTDVTGYEFTIFNRWGQPIWTTTDRFQAWDGRVEGDFVPLGVYAWYCTFRNGDGRQFTERGTVTFLYAVE